MRNLFVLAVVGLIAQLVDGSLGMAYGVTSTTEIGTTLVSGISHWRFGNVGLDQDRVDGHPGRHRSLFRGGGP